MSKRKKRIWLKEELILTYFVTKWGYCGLNITEYDLVNYVIGDTTINSFRRQMGNFRYLLGIQDGGIVLTDASKLMKEIVHELKDKTISQVRKVVQVTIDERKTSSNDNMIKDKNSSVKAITKALNRQLELNFQSNLKTVGQNRRLKKIN